MHVDKYRIIYIYIYIHSYVCVKLSAYNSKFYRARNSILINEQSWLATSTSMLKFSMLKKRRLENIENLLDKKDRIVKKIDNKEGRK